VEAIGVCACGCGQRTTRTKQCEGCYGAREYRRFVRGHWRRTLEPKAYGDAPRQPDGRRLTAHRLRAERALGHALPPAAIVHHADGSTRRDAPLVICQDEAYHKLLHRRMRIKALGGDPNLHRWCSLCQSLKRKASDFHRESQDAEGFAPFCRPCMLARRRAQYARGHASC
jgi:hypothetical protein